MCVCVRACVRERARARAFWGGSGTGVGWGGGGGRGTRLAKAVVWKRSVWNGFSISVHFYHTYVRVMLPAILAATHSDFRSQFL